MDSRGNPTVEAEIQTEQGIIARASVPSGASTGTREAQELRDGKEERFLGRGVLKAVKNVNESLGTGPPWGWEVEDQRGIDQLMIELDATENKNNLGANAMLAVSLCVTRAAACEQGKELFRLSQATFRLPYGARGDDSSGPHDEYYQRWASCGQ